MLFVYVRKRGNENINMNVKDVGSTSRRSGHYLEFVKEGCLSKEQSSGQGPSCGVVGSF